MRSAWLVAAVVRVDRAGRGSRRPPGATAGRLADQRQQQHVAAAGAVAGRRRRAAGAKACRLLPACVRDVVGGRGGRDPSLARRTARYAA